VVINTKLPINTKLFFGPINRVSNYTPKKIKLKNYLPSLIAPYNCSGDNNVSRSPFEKYE